MHLPWGNSCCVLKLPLMLRKGGQSISIWCRNYVLIIVIIGNGNWPGYRSAICMISSSVDWKFPISDGEKMNVMESFESCCTHSEWESVEKKNAKSVFPHMALCLAARFCACYHDRSLTDCDNSSKVHFIP